MNNLFIFIETFTNGYRVEILDLISIVSIICGIFVIISKNPIVSVLFLISLFLCISSYLIILGINFIGLSYLLVYVGAVSILFLFILMLINVRISELVNSATNSIPLAIIVAIAFNYPIYHILPYSIATYEKYIISTSDKLSDISHDNINNIMFNVLNITNNDIYKGKISFVTSKI